MKNANYAVGLTLLVACKSAPVAPSVASAPPAAPTGPEHSSVVTGDSLSCNLVEGVAWCWGRLGDNTATIDAAKPAAAASDVRFSMLSASGWTVCGVSTDGAGFCWGANTDGQLGTGSADAGSRTPVRVKGDLTFARIAAGGSTSCGITTTGEAYCWGENGSGEAGRGAAGPQDLLEPTLVTGGLRWTSISVGARFACGVTVEGAGYCWGDNSSGQLGGGGPISGQTTDVKPAPTAVAGAHKWQTISAGQFFACGLTEAGKALCWGQNNYQFGNGLTESSSTPLPVSGGHTFAKLDAGRDFACGVTSAGAAYCWGANGAGQLGHGPGDPADLSRAPLPVAMPGGTTVAEISAGDLEHTCALASDRRRVFCWGRNEHGQLGHGHASKTNTERVATPAQVVAHGGAQ